MKADGHAFWALLKIMDHLHSAACCRLTIRTEEPLLLTSISCLVCERDTTEPVKLMRYGGVVMTDGMRSLQAGGSRTSRRRRRGDRC